MVLNVVGSSPICHPCAQRAKSLSKRSVPHGVLRFFFYAFSAVRPKGALFWGWPWRGGRACVVTSRPVLDIVGGVSEERNG